MLEPRSFGYWIIANLHWKNDQKISEIQALEKAYTGIITLGATTFYDLETAIDKSYSKSYRSKYNKRSQKKFEGEIDQYLQFSLPLKKKGKGFTNTPERVKKQ